MLHFLHILELKCSEKLGVARFELDGNTILPYYNAGSIYEGLRMSQM